MGKSVKTYEAYRAKDEKFRKDVDAIRLALAGGATRQPVPPFDAFSKEYLGQEVFEHQQ